MSDEKRKPKRWLVLIPEGDEVEFARSPLKDGTIIVTDADELKKMMAATPTPHDWLNKPFTFGLPIYRAEVR